MDSKMTLMRMANQAARDANPHSPHGAAMIKAGRGFICRPDATEAEIISVIRQLKDCQEILGADAEMVLAAAKALAALRAN